jgi:hypothetical protein
MATRGKRRPPDGTSMSGFQQPKNGAGSRLSTRSTGDESALTGRRESLRTEHPPGELTAGADEERLRKVTGCKTNPAALLVLRQVSELGQALD